MILASDLVKRLQAVLAEMDADILGPRPRQIPKRWPEELRAIIHDIGKGIAFHHGGPDGPDDREPIAEADAAEKFAQNCAKQKREREGK